MLASCLESSLYEEYVQGSFTGFEAVSVGKVGGAECTSKGV
jgi:hypothetical protein